MLARLQDKEPEPYELVVVHKRYQPHLHIPGTWVSKREGGEPEAEGEERKIARAQTPVQNLHLGLPCISLEFLPPLLLLLTYYSTERKR